MGTGKLLPSPFLELCLQQTILKDEVMSPGRTKNRLAKKEVESPNHALHLDGPLHVYCGTCGTGAINIKNKLMLLPMLSITVLSLTKDFHVFCYHP